MTNNVLSGLGSRKLAFSLRTLLSAGLLSLYAACGGAARPPANSPADGASVVGELAPESEFAVLQGSGTINLSSLRGKGVLLDFWASWCAPCQEELPLLDDMAVRLKDKGVEVVGLSIDDSPGDAEQFLTRKSSWSLTLGHDSDQKVANHFKPPKMPTSYVIDRKGVVRQVNAGFERDDMKKIEAQLLELAAAD
jgi:thiol-disulfide isomerase/thioredoxin